MSREEPSVALEWDIATAIGWEYNPRAQCPWLDLENKRRALCAYFTRSLDAAVGLVPEDCLWSVSALRGGAISRVWGFGLDIQVDAPVHALALCAAALRARATLEN